MAKRFIFRFDTMLRIRRQREDQHQRIVADRLRQITRARGQIGAITRQIHEELDAIRVGQDTGTIDIQQVMRHRHWLGHLHKASLEAQARLRTFEARLAQERAQLAEAVKQRRILEKLKERQYDRHRTEEERRETREGDDLTTIRYVFQQRQELEVVQA